MLKRLNEMEMTKQDLFLGLSGAILIAFFIQFIS